jgi:hypothetical protein
MNGFSECLIVVKAGEGDESHLSVSVFVLLLFALTLLFLLFLLFLLSLLFSELDDTITPESLVGLRSGNIRMHDV